MTTPLSIPVRLLIATGILIFTFTVGYLTDSKSDSAKKLAPTASMRQYSGANARTGISLEALMKIELPSEEIVDYSDLLDPKKKLSPSSDQEAELLRKKLIEWAKIDPLAALAFARNQIDHTVESKFAVTAIVRQWALAEPQKAWDWSVENSIYDTALLLKAMAKADSEVAWANAAEFAKMERNQEHPHLGFGNTIDGMLINGDHLTALEFIKNTDIPNPPDRDISYDFIEYVMASWVTHNPEAALEWVANLPENEDPERKTNAEKAFMTIWQLSDPIEAMEFTKNLRKEETLDHYKAIMQVGLDAMFDRDVFEAQAWLSEQESTEDYDWPMVTLVTKPRLLNTDIHSAIHWAQKISAPDLRDEAFIGIATHWFINEPEVAAQYFQEHPNLLTKEVKERALFDAQNELELMNTPHTYNGYD